MAYILTHVQMCPMLAVQKVPHASSQTKYYYIFVQKINLIIKYITKFTSKISLTYVILIIIFWQNNICVQAYEIQQNKLERLLWN